MTLQQMITQGKMIINERHITDEEVLETIENCIEEDIGERDLELQMYLFKRYYASWINYHSELADDYRRDYE